MTALPCYPYVHVRVPEDAVDGVSAKLFALGAEGIEERDVAEASSGFALLVASMKSEEQAQIAALQFASDYPTEVVILEGDSWRDAWKAYFKATKLGTRLWVTPSFETADAAPGDVVVQMDPGRAFGSGIHETTRLVLRALETALHPDDRLLDLGAGSGILAIAALKLGAAQAVAIDVDTDTFPVAEENAVRNGVASRFVVHGASLDGIKEPFSFVVANIQRAILVPMATALSACVASPGQLILSGVLAPEEDQVRQAYAPFFGPEPVVSREGEWIALHYHRRAQPA